MDERVDYKEGWAPKNWCFGEDSWKSLGLQGDPTCPFSPGCSLEGLMLKLKLQYFGHLMRRADLKRPWCWERLRTGREGDNRGWDDWMASLTRWTWLWVNSGSWWWTRRPGMLWFMGLQRVGHDWATELNWPPSLVYFILYIFSVLTFHHISVYTFPSGQRFCPVAFQMCFFFFFFFLTFTELLAMYRECFFFFIKKHFCSTEEKCRACYLLKGFLSISNDPKLSSYSLPTQFCSSE